MLVLRHLLARGSAVEGAAALAAVQSGRLRQLAAQHLSTAAEQPEQDANVLLAQPRTEGGSRAAERLRKEGKTPGILFSFPGEEQKLVAFDAKAIKQQLQRLGRTGWACRLFSVQLQGADGQPAETIPALGRQVHMTADTDAIENVTLMYCPPERVVRVDVPLKVYGEEVCPGLKAGGKINWIRRTIPCVAPGARIPKGFEVDVSRMGLNQKVLLNELPLPEGVQLREKNHSLPVIKIAK